MKRMLSFFLVVFFMDVAFPQDTFDDFTFVNVMKDVSKAGIYTILQDNQGFIWVGTSGSGLYRYDGMDHVSYKNDIRDKTSISSSLVICSYQDAKGRIWIGTDEGLDLYDRERDQFKRIRLFSADGTSSQVSVSSLNEDDRGNMLIGTYGQGLLQMDPATHVVEFVEAKVPGEGELTIHAIQRDSKDRVYVGTDHGLLKLDFHEKALIPVQLGVQSEGIGIGGVIRSMVIDGDDRIWAGTFSQGLYRVNRNSNGLLSGADHFPISQNTFLSMTKLSDGSLLCGTENDGLFHMDPNGSVRRRYLYSKEDEKGILSNSIWALLEDRDGKIWMGYYNKGLSVYDPLFDKFPELESLYNNPNSLQVSSVTSIVEDSSGKLFIGMDGGGIDIYDPDKNHFTHINTRTHGAYSGLTSDYIQTIFLDSHQNLWAGSWDKGLFFLKKGSTHFINYSPNNTNGIFTANTVMSIDEGPNGDIWIGSYRNGLYTYRPGTGDFAHHGDIVGQNGPNGYFIWKILFDNDGDLWMGTTKGLYRVYRSKNGGLSVKGLQEGMQKEYDNPVTANHILSLYQTEDDILWIGTKGAGICRYDKTSDTFVWYNTYKGQKQENVCGIIGDDRGNIWLGGNSGITKMELGTGKFTDYSINDGLLSNDYNMNSTFRDNKGYIYFGGYQGIDYFDPEEIIKNTDRPSLYLKDLKLFNQKVTPLEKGSPLARVISESDSIVLNNKQSVFTIEYAGISYTRPEKNNYAYYLEGYEKTWNYVGNAKSATYTNLAPGNYVFKLKASNNDGVWSESPLTLAIKVLPPWWKSSWAIILYVILLLSALYLLNWLTNIRIQERQMVSNEREKRLQEAELNERKFQFFTNISHEFRTPLTLIANPLKDILKDTALQLPEDVREKHRTIYRNTNRLSRLVDELLDFRKLEINKVEIRASKLCLGDFMVRVTDHFKEEARSRGIQMDITTQCQVIELWADSDMLEKIAFNILSNAFKVTPDGGSINIEMYRYEEPVLLPLVDSVVPVQAVEFSISDTGPGLHEDQLEKIFERFYQVQNLNNTYYGGTGIGLEVVESFVKLHKGKVTVDSRLGEGTTFRVILPAGNAHFTEQEILQDPTIHKEAMNQYDNVQTAIVPSDKVGQTACPHTLLIVEDNAELRNYLFKELSAHYRTRVAKNGKEGLMLAKQLLPDVILTDVIMPEMDGYELCRRIKGDMRTSHIPVLMLTAKSLTDDHIQGIEQGADEYLVKPFDMRLLQSRLSQLITTRQLIFNKYFGELGTKVEFGHTDPVDKEFIEKILEHIHANIGDPLLGVESLASELKLSRSQLYRKIKTLSGMTASEFIRSVRLKVAKQILENGGETNIGELSYRVGFSSPSYFTKCFKHHFGVIPTQLAALKNSPEIS
ncbi:hybrid sensor histidine kinase/response regulator transcription factor [Flagellimonas hadalis]|uniref:histidine kinase n=1 Tax=Flagellimonas hadalis TaxID=2597517 RepID=A0A5N5IV76_9FLAO|nr:hybrid sensor histidine kinase/response regulator transcription factor [Allomuricauda hadalis]KAB5490639.1 response regulator [Allomuricauda hadalis]